MINELTLNALQQVRDDMKNLLDEERLHLMRRLADDYCVWCGIEEKGRACQCWNDE